MYKAPIDTVLSVGGLPLTGMGMLLSIQERPLQAKTEDVDLVGVPYVHSVKTGKLVYGFAVSGYVRDDDGSVTRLRNSDQESREPHSVIYARFGDAPGAHADLAPEMIATGGVVELPKDGLVKVNGIQYELGAAAGLLPDGTLVANRKDVAASGSPYADLRHDFGAAHVNRWTLIVHVANVVWDGATQLDVRLYTTAQANGGGGWAAVSPAGSHRFQAADGSYQDSVEISDVDLSRWVGLGMAWTAGGADRRANITAALHRA